MITENGWPSCGADMLERNPIPGTQEVVPFQRGIPNALLKAFFADLHAYVENAIDPRGGTDEGGWTPTNSVRTSNHLGGTAGDYNWRQHPMGKAYDGWSPEEIAVIRELLAFYTFEGLQLIWWANDWDSPKDSMHFQMGYGTYHDGAPDPRCQRFINQFIRPDGFSTFRRGGGLPSVPRKLVIPDAGGCFWNDVSQYQGNVIDSSYPYRIVSWRTNTGDKVDSLGEANTRAVKSLIDAGKIDIAIPYYFFRPGEANCDLHRVILTNAGLFNHPKTVTMVDVEGDNGSVSGDNSWEINDEINRIRGWYGNFARVIGYLNPNADSGLWPTRAGINLVIPQYNRTPGDITSVRDAIAKKDAIAHQFSSTATDQKPWVGKSVDVNWSPYSVDDLLKLFGMVSEVDELADPAVVQKINEIWDALFKPKPSRARYADDGTAPDQGWAAIDLVRNIDGMSYDESVETKAIRGDAWSVKRVVRNVLRGDSDALLVATKINATYLQSAGVTIEQLASGYTAAINQNPRPKFVQ